MTGARRKRVVTAVCLVVAGALTAGAEPRRGVFFDFNSPSVAGTAPNQVWTYTDTLGPYLTTGQVFQSNGSLHVADWDGSPAVDLSSAAGPPPSPIKLGDGANGELAYDFPFGLRIAAKFKIEGGLAVGSQVVVGRYDTTGDNRSYRLLVNYDVGVHARKIWFQFGSTGIGVDTLATTVQVTEGNTYEIEAVFSPATGTASMTVTGLVDSIYEHVSKATTVSNIFIGAAPLYIGGAGGPVTTFNRFNGKLDNVRIEALPGPPAGTVVSVR